MTAHKFSVGQSVVLMQPFAYRKFSEKYENIKVGTVGCVIHSGNGQLKDEPYYFVDFMEHGSHNISESELELFVKPPRIVSLTDKNVSSIYTVEILMETADSYFCRNSQQQERVYLKSEWDILEGGDQIAEMVHSAKHCIRICDAIEIYKAGFRKVEK